MIGKAFDAANVTMMGGPGVTDVKAHIGQHSDGSKVTITKWQVSPEELADIQRTGEVWLFIYGAGMTPVALSTIDPFTP
tara:strand:- start:1814 stop:2050 length:237 start_codon:yes stop_codon:yes gene_type:complete